MTEIGLGLLALTQSLNIFPHSYQREGYIFSLVLFSAIVVALFVCLFV